MKSSGDCKCKQRNGNVGETFNECGGGEECREADIDKAEKLKGNSYDWQVKEKGGEHSMALVEGEGSPIETILTHSCETGERLGAT